MNPNQSKFRPTGSHIQILAGDPASGPYYLNIVELDESLTHAEVYWVVRDHLEVIGKRSKGLPGVKGFCVNLHDDRSGWIRVLGYTQWTSLLEILRHVRIRGHPLYVHNPGYRGGDGYGYIKDPYPNDGPLCIPAFKFKGELDIKFTRVPRRPDCIRVDAQELFEEAQSRAINQVTPLMSRLTEYMKNPRHDVLQMVLEDTLRLQTTTSASQEVSQSHSSAQPEVNPPIPGYSGHREEPMSLPAHFSSHREVSRPLPGPSGRQEALMHLQAQPMSQQMSRSVPHQMIQSMDHLMPYPMAQQTAQPTAQPTSQPIQRAEPLQMTLPMPLRSTQPISQSPSQDMPLHHQLIAQLMPQASSQMQNVPQFPNPSPPQLMLQAVGQLMPHAMHQPVHQGEVTSPRSPIINFGNPSGLLHQNTLSHPVSTAPPTPPMTPQSGIFDQVSVTFNISFTPFFILTCLTA
ncbi:hypothetical protein QBC38DRAFT_92689 [Podospora fimiseda]|uniref:Uncharacterized protein n=1 Tax=Podospora fimiseda TaxID=252190 RepID=A0AAN7H8R6_9PEZI|nr:hypothetical protein QBC38DRAFT_92689 [Podospora fimiseda]